VYVGYIWNYLDMIQQNQMFSLANKKMQKGGNQKNWMITSTIKSFEGGCIAIEHLE